LPRNLETEAELIPAIGRLKSGKKEAEIGIYTPSEFHKILTAAQKHLLAPIAIGGFAGLRSAEVHRLLWGEVHDSHIVVKAGNAKTGSRRIVPVLPALKAWLAKVERGDPTERVCARFSHENGLARAQTVAIKSAGVTPVHNGLRHSFCTYRLAEIQDAAKVALEAGNSPQMLFKHYRALATATTAAEWFSIGMPASRSRGRPRSRKAKQKKKTAA
jgi:integrase